MHPAPTGPEPHINDIPQGLMHESKCEKCGVAAPGPDRHGRCSSSMLHLRRPPYLQLLEFLARQKALAGGLEQNDAVRHQLLSLLLKPGDHARLQENLAGEKAAGDFPAEPDCLKPTRQRWLPLGPCVHLKYLLAAALDGGSESSKHRVPESSSFPAASPQFSECGPHTSSPKTAKELVKNADSWAPPQTR